VYPDGFLVEIILTLQLLFPTIGAKEKRQARCYVRKLKSDLDPDVENGLTKLDQIDLSRYPFFGERLAAIQRHYDNSTPQHLRQWWYDRRKRVELATLAVAVVVFILTIIFGVVSMITGILQVYASFRWH
jgi:hypothetical protein